jgi:hypothetical protein
MKSKTLFLEPRCSYIIDCLEKMALEQGFCEVSPTPIISPFWQTTFTPSSSEIVFRALNADLKLPDKLCSCQPCIRITDIPKLSDSWHLVLFHMLTFVHRSPQDLSGTILTLLSSIVKLLDIDINNLLFTVSDNPLIDNSNSPLSLGSEALKSLGISEQKILICQGFLNYQKTSLLTGNGWTASMIGPKIEIYYDVPNSLPREIATLEIADASISEGRSETVFACAFGLERLASISYSSLNLFQMPLYSELIEKLSSLIHPSMASSTLGKSEIQEFIVLLDAFIFASPAISDFIENDGSGRRQNNRGINGHYIKLSKALKNKSLGIGLDLNKALEVLEIDISKIYQKANFLDTSDMVNLDYI